MEVLWGKNLDMAWRTYLLYDDTAKAVPYEDNGKAT